MTTKNRNKIMQKGPESEGTAQWERARDMFTKVQDLKKQS
jgi:hypothetical protein